MSDKPVMKIEVTEELFYEAMNKYESDKNKLTIQWILLSHACPKAQSPSDQSNGPTLQRDQHKKKTPIVTNIWAPGVTGFNSEYTDGNHTFKLCFDKKEDRPAELPKNVSHLVLAANCASTLMELWHKVAETNINFLEFLLYDNHEETGEALKEPFQHHSMLIIRQRPQQAIERAIKAFRYAPSSRGAKSFLPRPREETKKTADKREELRMAPTVKRPMYCPDPFVTPVNIGRPPSYHLTDKTQAKQLPELRVEDIYGTRPPKRLQLAPPDSMAQDSSRNMGSPPPSDLPTSTSNLDIIFSGTANPNSDEVIHEAIGGDDDEYDLNMDIERNGLPVQTQQRLLHIGWKQDQEGEFWNKHDKTHRCKVTIDCIRLHPEHWVRYDHTKDPELTQECENAKNEILLSTKQARLAQRQ